MKNPERTTLLINLSVEEAQRIREAARKQDRTISAYVVRALMNRIRVENEVQKQQRQPFFDRYLDNVRSPR
jgi:predicted transcriptional regulator